MTDSTISAPILLLPDNLGGWHYHARVFGEDRCFTSCWNPECLEAEHVIKQCDEDRRL